MGTAQSFLNSESNLMKKSFPTQSGNHAPARVIEGIKGEIKKYLKRERNKKLPEGVDFWDFDCRVGVDKGSAKNVHVQELSKAIDETTASEPEVIYIEILAKKGHRNTA